MEGSILDFCLPLSEVSKAFIPHRSPSVILNVVVDLGLLLLVPGRRHLLLRLPFGARV